MSKAAKEQVVEATIDATDEAWESGVLGRSEAHVRISTSVDEKAINDALELQKPGQHRRSHDARPDR